jgi:hypothetical protein
MKKDAKIFKITLAAMIISAFLFMPLTVSGQTGKVNFAGTWALNAEKSNFGQGQGQPQGQPPQGQPAGQGQGQGMRGGFGGGNFVAKQEANLLTVDRTRPGQNGGEATTVTSKYTLDGKECVNTTGMGDSKSVATWSADGLSLTIVTNRTFDRNGTSTTTKTTEVWTLTNPTTLTVVSTRTSANGDRTSSMVYDKK